MSQEQQILSPMPTGNGAYVVHKILESKIKNYKVKAYNPLLTLFPPALFFGGRSGTPSILHTTPDYAIFSYRQKAPTVLTFHNYVLDSWIRDYSSIFQKMHYLTDLRLWTRMAVEKAHTLTAVSHYTADLAKKDLKIFKPIKIIPNGVDTTLFRPEKSNTGRNHIRVFFSGNLTKRKGAHWLPAIAGKFSKNMTLYYTQGLRTKDRVKSTNKISPLGAISFFDMPDRYKQMDILLLPTVREGLSLSVLEAMACGLPVVASDCSSIPELVDHGKGGFLCPVGDVGAFADKINLLADSPKLREEMGGYNRAKVEKYFNLERMVRGYKQLFEEVLNTL